MALSKDEVDKLVRITTHVQQAGGPPKLPSVDDDPEIVSLRRQVGVLTEKLQLLANLYIRESPRD